MTAGRLERGETSDSTAKDARGLQSDEVRVRRDFLIVALACDFPRAGGARFGLEGVSEVVIGRGESRTAHREPGSAGARLVLSLPGRSLSSRHARILRTPEGWLLVDEGSTNGSYFNGNRTQRQLLTPDGFAELGHTFFLVRSYARPVGEEAPDLNELTIGDDPIPGFVTLVPPLADRLAELRRVAPSSLPVVLTGATGTGKEVLARGLHALSGRRGPFVAVNCGALTKSLAESQLFGHLKGSFSGAVADAPGFVRSAHGGTLLLDELADLDKSLQPILLRVLQEREVVPVGSARPQAVDVRFISTSPQSLEELVVRGVLRPDLHARLSGFTHAAPLLCERREDLGLLIAAVLKKHDVTSMRLSPEHGLRLLQHSWPLNVRELEQTLLRGVALATDGVIGPAPMPVGGGSVPVASEAGVLSTKDTQLRQQLIRELESAGGNVAEVARKLGKARMQVQRWMKRLAIDPGSFRT